MIKPKYIHIQNFNNITDAEIDLSSAVSLFVGDNGSGKTSVVDAIGLCLFEYKRSDTYADYIKSGENSAHIYFECEISGEPITFNIAINKTGSTVLEREVNFQGNVYHNSEVSTLLESLNLKYFSDIFCSMQNGKDITRLSPTERVAYIQRLLAFSFGPQTKIVDDTIKQLTENITELSTTNAALNQTIQNLEKQIKPLNNLDNLYSDIDSIKAKANQLQSYIVSKTAALRSNAAVAVVKDRINAEIVALTNELTSKNTKAAEIKLANESREKIADKINEVKTVISDYEAKTKDIEVKLNDLDAQYKAQEVFVQNKSTEYYAAEAQFNVCKSNFDKVNHDKCPYCGQTISEDNKAHYKQELENAEKTVLKLQQDLSAEKDKLNVLSNSRADILKEKMSLTALFDAQNNQLRSHETELACIDNELVQLRPLLENINSIEQAIKDKQNLLKLENEKLLEIDNEEWNNSQKQLSEYNQIIANYQRVVDENTHIQAANEALQKNIDSQRQTLDKNIEKYTLLSDDLSVYKEAKQIFEKKLPQFIIIKTCKKIQSKLNELVQTIFPNLYIRLFYSKKGIEFFYSTSGVTDEDMDKESMLPIKQASGFEKAILSICFKSVLCEAYNIPFVILDEVDAAASEENSRRFFDIVINGGLFQQSIIISHKIDIQDTIKGMSDSISAYMVADGDFEHA